MLMMLARAWRAAASQPRPAAARMRPIPTPKQVHNRPLPARSGRFWQCPSHRFVCAHQPSLTGPKARSCSKLLCLIQALSLSAAPAL